MKGTKPNGKEVISVIGLGVVGLTTAVGFASRGHKVIGVDIDPEKVKQINRKECPIYEVGLSQALKTVDLHATQNYDEVLESDVTFLCGGTPPKKDGSIDLRFLEQPASQLAEVIKTNGIKNHLIVVRSTVVPGTTDAVIRPLFKDFKSVSLCVNPEFLREGTSIEDFLNPSRIVIGSDNEDSCDLLCKVYRDFKCSILKTDIRTAEMIKQASNAFLANRISFINEIGNICKQLGMDVYEVAEGMGQDPRIGREYLRAGIGFGGFCLPKDISALVATAKEAGYEPKILEEIMRLNKAQPLRLIEILKKHIPLLKGKTIGVLGLAFKPGTDDIRSSKAMDIIEILLKEGAEVKAYDPQAMANFKKFFKKEIQYSDEKTILNSDAILILTEWEEFNKLDYRGKIVIDGRRVEKAKEAKVYEGICW